MRVSTCVFARCLSLIVLDHLPHPSSSLQVFTMTYCIASEALMYPFNKNPSIVETIFSSFKRAYLNVFGDIGMEAIEEKIIEGKQPIRTRNLGHVTGYQPIRDQYFLVRSVPGSSCVSRQNYHNIVCMPPSFFETEFAEI